MNPLLRAVCSTLAACVASIASATAVYPDVPEQINPSAKYVFYSHGYIVEGDNETPIHKRWGKYDFPAIKQALSDDAYTLIAEHRPKGVAPETYTKTLVSKVRNLLDAGVSASNITLVGFSRGGALTIMASDALKNDAIHYVVLAGCAGLIKSKTEIQLYGKVLSVYETSDQVGSCDFVKARSTNLKSFTELSISTGKEHGAFYLPRDEWLKPVKSWILNH
ncbi:alpha/beta hydrolase [Pseudoalteromonas sp. OANN1]|uniref:alpha/beta hydrolase n=1 Tax=Pseudoalteromonas sp. OANN1 TaxID=2954497 RepID=UPI0020983E1A|nr:alpha/beta hydrolase [Pseudoalteromonas sp. OANN1]MCO7199074.1 alpha/beta hydrolase [Pseudoalteromonas sp. OANN1]